jgi:HlyD family type I secretion membrane fusion protein
MTRLEKLRQWLSAGELDDGAEVSNLMRRGQWIILVGFIGFGLWAAFAPVDGAVVANGVVKVVGQRKAVQHAEGGIVQAIRARNGDLVKAGDVLVELKDLRTDAGADLLDAQWVMQQATAARLRAERKLAAQIEFPEALRKRVREPETAAAMQRERELFEARRQSLNRSLALLDQQQRELQERIKGLDLQVKGESEARDLAKEELDSYISLAESGAVSQAQLLAAKRRQADYDVRVGDHLAEMAAARQSLTDLRLRVESLRNEFRDNANGELVKVETQLVDVRERLRPSSDAAQRLQVTAPVDGIVVNSKVHTVGGVLGAGEVLMEIVPADQPLQVEARIPLDAIAQVSPGQQANIQFTAFRQRITPMVAGTVTYVSADMLDDPQTQTSYYLVNLVTEVQALREAGIDKLVPGMPAVAYMRTRPRTMMEYLLEPVTDAMQRSFREQ